MWHCTAPLANTVVDNEYEISSSLNQYEVKLFMNYIEKISLKIFVIYRVFLGLVILLFVYFN